MTTASNRPTPFAGTATSGREPTAAPSARRTINTSYPPAGPVAGTVVGAGIVAGGPYGCAEGQLNLALNRCMQTALGEPDPAALAARAEALAATVARGGYSTTMLDGVTGSGKTEVYFEAIAEALTSLGNLDGTEVRRQRREKFLAIGRSIG